MRDARLPAGWSAAVAWLFVTHAGCALAGGDGGPADATERHALDASYDYLTGRADALAVWFDSFFGDRAGELETADTVLRLRAQYRHDGQDGDDAGLRLRGKVYLPALDRRFSIVFSEEAAERDEVLPEVEPADGDVAVQYAVRELPRSRLYVSLGVDGDLDLRTSLRYRYARTLTPDWRLQFSERVFHKTNEGFGTVTRGDIDYLLGGDRFLRLTNQFTYGETSAGLEWGSRLSWQLRLDPRSALRLYVGGEFETDPRWIERAWGVGIQYRRSFWRPWLFFELEPAHLWRLQPDDRDRDPVWVMQLRLEVNEELWDSHPGGSSRAQGR